MAFLKTEIDMIHTLEGMIEEIRNNQEKEGKTEGEIREEEDQLLLSQQLLFRCTIENLDLEPGIKCHRVAKE